MSHHHRRIYEEKEPVETIPVEKSIAPLFEKNDIAILTTLKPMFSANVQKMIDILAMLNSGGSQSSYPDLTRIISQLAPNGENNKLSDMLPLLLGLLSKPEVKNMINPAMINSFMSMLGSKKEPVDNETNLRSDE